MPKKPKTVLNPGDKIGRWTIMEKVDVPAKPGKRKYSRHRCQCECGEVAVLLTAPLLSGRSTQCKKCRTRARSLKTKVEGGSLLSVRLPEKYHQFLRQYSQEHFNSRSIGKSVRHAIKQYRDIGHRRTGSDYLKCNLRQTTVVITEDDRQWLKKNHDSVLDGILNAVDLLFFTV